MMLLALLPALLPPLAAAAQSPPPSSDTVLRVAVREVPPFAMRDADGRWQGVSVDLWRLVAGQQALVYELVEADLKQTLSGLADGELDAGIAAISVTPERERKLDFAHPYLVTGLALAWPARPEGAWSRTLRAFGSVQFVSAVGTLALLLLASGTLAWLAERRANPAQFGNGKPLQGIGAGFWWSAVTMTTVGYGDKVPVTVAGRALAIVWMFASLILVASLTAAIAASLTTNSLESSQLRNRPLADLRLGVVSGSVAEDYARNHGASVVAGSNLAAALQLLREGQVDAVLHDAPVIKYVVRADWPDLQVERRLRARDDYAFALPSGSSLRERINPDLLEVIASQQWAEIRARFLGDTGD